MGSGFHLRKNKLRMQQNALAKKLYRLVKTCTHAVIEQNGKLKAKIFCLREVETQESTYFCNSGQQKQLAVQPKEQLENQLKLKRMLLIK